MGPVKSAINIPEERLTTLRGAFLRFQATVDVEADYAWVLMTFFPAERTYVRRCHWYAGIKECRHDLRMSLVGGELEPSTKRFRRVLSAGKGLLDLR